MDWSKIKFYEEWDGHGNPSINSINQGRPTDGQISSCLSLMGMKKRANESFRQYTARWMEEAAQIHPLLTKEKMIVRFIDTLQAFYYKKDNEKFSKQLCRCGHTLWEDR